MIERDIKVIKERQKVSRTKTSQELKMLSRRQTSHEKANTKQFQVITTAISSLPTQDVITKTIQDTIKVVVNGKIDKLTLDVASTNNKVDMVGEHLKRQDDALEVLSKKIIPIDKTREFFQDLFRGLLYIGAIAGALWAIIKLFHLAL